MVMALALVGLLCLLGLAGWQLSMRIMRSQPEARVQALIDRVVCMSGLHVDQHCVSGDLSACLGLDSRNNVLVLAEAKRDAIMRIAPRDLIEVELAEDGETVARTVRRQLKRTEVRPGAGRTTAHDETIIEHRTGEQRMFARVRSVDLLITVGAERKVYRFKLMDTAAAIDRTDPVYVKACDVGDRWYDIISGLMQGNREQEQAEALSAIRAHAHAAHDRGQQLRDWSDAHANKTAF